MKTLTALLSLAPLFALSFPLPSPSSSGSTRNRTLTTRPLTAYVSSQAEVVSLASTAAATCIPALSSTPLYKITLSSDPSLVWVPVFDDSGYDDWWSGVTLTSEDDDYHTLFKTYFNSASNGQYGVSYRGWTDECINPMSNGLLYAECEDYVYVLESTCETCTGNGGTGCTMRTSDVGECITSKGEGGAMVTSECTGGDEQKWDFVVQ
ncbi:hypothetical protein JCM8547_005399 [Rhodosporidiobolus lusitaniae]